MSQTASHPFPDIANNLLPGTLLRVELFSGSNLGDLAQVINRWVETTGNLLVVPGAVSFVDGKYFLAVTYVAATENSDDSGRKTGQQPVAADSITVVTGTSRDVNVSSWWQ